MLISFMRKKENKIKYNQSELERQGYCGTVTLERQPGELSTPCPLAFFAQQNELHFTVLIPQAAKHLALV